jgi:hypothetical protein
MRRLIHGVLDRIVAMQNAMLKLVTESRSKI